MRTDKNDLCWGQRPRKQTVLRNPKFVLRVKESFLSVIFRNSTEVSSVPTVFGYLWRCFKRLVCDCKDSPMRVVKRARQEFGEAGGAVRERESVGLHPQPRTVLGWQLINPSSDMCDITKAKHYRGCSENLSFIALSVRASKGWHVFTASGHEPGPAEIPLRVRSYY